MISPIKSTITVSKIELNANEYKLIYYFSSCTVLYMKQSI